MERETWGELVELARFAVDPMESDQYAGWLLRSLRRYEPTDAPALVAWLRGCFEGRHFLPEGQATPRAMGWLLVYLLEHPEMGDREYLHEHRINLLQVAADHRAPENPRVRSWLLYRGVQGL